MTGAAPQTVTPSAPQSGTDLLITMRAAVDASQAATVANRPGYRTTEFWLALVVVIGSALQSVYATEPWAKAAGMVAGALAAAGYGFARSAVKAAP